MNTMKALNLTAVGTLEYVDMPDPKPKAGEVLIKIKACGICGSDVIKKFLTHHFQLTDILTAFKIAEDHAGFRVIVTP